jgi:hypothetical protein
MKPMRMMLVIGTTLLLGAEAQAVTKAQESLVPLAAACAGGTCNNRRGACSTTADCLVGILARTSSLRLDGALKVKVGLKGVTDAVGTPVTTDGTLGSPDDRLVKICFTAFIPGRTETCVYLHVELAAGKGKLTFVATPLGALFSPGSAVELTGTEVLAPPTDPARCPGNNDTSDVQTFFTNQVGLPTKPGCEDGGTIGVGGVANGE